jgi:hypothetical protein
MGYPGGLFLLSRPRSREAVAQSSSVRGQFNHVAEESGAEASQDIFVH